MKVLKFGGTSMASESSIMQSVSIAKKEKEAIIVVSAPGKRDKNDVKITDMLIECHKARLKCGRCDIPFSLIRERFLNLCQRLGIDGIDPYLNQILHDINSGAGYMYTISRGEYLSSLIMRHLLDCELTDASNLIKFDIYGKLDASYTQECIKKRLIGCGRAVVPGFYGSLPNGEIKTFSRGGSDVTGAVIASAINASIYENWTDVDGIYFSTHLRLPIKKLTYRQARALTYMGAYVLHPDSLVYLHKSSIKTMIKNTFNPLAEGTLISNEPHENQSGVWAISGQNGFKILSFYKMGGIDDEFFSEIIEDVKKQGAKIFSALGGVDLLTLIINGQTSTLRHNPQSQDDIALFTILSFNKKRTLEKLCALDIDYKVICSDIYADGITIGVSENQFNTTLEALSVNLS